MYSAALTNMPPDEGRFLLPLLATLPLISKKKKLINDKITMIIMIVILERIHFYQHFNSENITLPPSPHTELSFPNLHEVFGFDKKYLVEYHHLVCANTIIFKLRCSPPLTCVPLMHGIESN